MNQGSIDKELHDAQNFEALDKKIMRIAQESTGARNGALFLWDPEEDGLTIAHHVVKGLTVTLPHTVCLLYTSPSPRDRG